MTLSYQEALDYLYSLINYEVQRPERYTPDVVSLDRPRALMRAFGDPQEQYPILHLTGTKGKGSVSAMCASVLQASGLKVGLYSSPHLQDFRERFLINGEMITPEALTALVERVRPVVEGISGLTWFEVITAIAFLHFAQSKVDVAVIEVGLGGRLDATNIIKTPKVSVITSLSFDHTHLLGSTIAQIAAEKAGIIKPGCPVVSAPQPPEGLSVIQQTAAERAAPLTIVGQDLLYQTESGDEYGQSFRVTQPGGQSLPLWTPLIGAHQSLNATVAVAALRTLKDLAPSDHAIRTGIASVNWAGRLEVIRRAPYLVLDVAHNGASAERLRDALSHNFPSVRRRVLVFGAFKDKDVQGMFSALLPITDHLILMQPVNSRAFNTDDLITLARENGFTGQVEAHPAASDALIRAESLATDPSDLICVTGSLSVVGEIRSVLNLPPTHASYLDELTVRALQSAR